MPTYEGTAEFWRDFRRLTPTQRNQFVIAVRKLVHDLKAGDMRAGLRIRDFRRLRGVKELTWAPDGGALFRYGDPTQSGDVHIIWLRVGTHDIFDEP